MLVVFLKEKTNGTEVTGSFEMTSFYLGLEEQKLGKRVTKFIQNKMENKKLFTHWTAEEMKRSEQE